jgi:hypothetical protein
MNEVAPLYVDTPLCRFLASLQAEIEEVAACEAGRPLRRPKPPHPAFLSTIDPKRRETGRRQYR